MNSSKLFLFSREVHFNSSVTLLLELYCVVVIKHVAFFTIRAKLTVAFTWTSLPWNLYPSVFGSGCGFGFEQKILTDRRIWRKKDTDRRVCILLFTPLLTEISNTSQTTRWPYSHLLSHHWFYPHHQGPKKKLLAHSKTKGELTTFLAKNVKDNATGRQVVVAWGTECEATHRDIRHLRSTLIILLVPQPMSSTV